MLRKSGLLTSSFANPVFPQASQTGTSLALNGIWTLLSQIAFLPPVCNSSSLASKSSAFPNLRRSFASDRPRFPLSFGPLQLQIAFGIATLYHYLNAGWIFIFFLLPFLNHLAIVTGSTDSSVAGGGLAVTVWVAVAILLMLSTVFNMASSSE